MSASYAKPRIEGTFEMFFSLPHAVAEVPNLAYWKHPFTFLCSARELIEYIVLDVELLGPTRGKARKSLGLAPLFVLW